MAPFYCGTGWGGGRRWYRRRNLRGWCNWQHTRFWSWLSGFESLPPSTVSMPGRTRPRREPPFRTTGPRPDRVIALMGSLIKKRRKRMRKKKHRKMLKRTRFQRRAAGK